MMAAIATTRENDERRNRNECVTIDKLQVHELLRIRKRMGIARVPVFARNNHARLARLKSNTGEMVCSSPDGHVTYRLPFTPRLDFGGLRSRCAERKTR